jgi:acetyltransferase-like isoleucine patch superfamily enzyme
LRTGTITQTAGAPAMNGNPRGSGLAGCLLVMEKHRLQEAYWAAWRSRRALSRALFLARIRTAAWIADSTVDLDVAVDAVVPADVRVHVAPGTSSTLRIGSGTRIGRALELRLMGGTISLGADCDIREWVSLHAKGELRIGDGVLLSRGVCVMCDVDVRFDDHAIIGHYTVVADTTHRRTAPDQPIHHSPMRTAPTRVGRNTHLGVHVTVSPGVTIGDQAFIGANSVVTSDVPPGWLAVGSPARAVRELQVGE